MNNSELYNLHIWFYQQVKGIRLQLVNGNLDVIFDDIANEINLPLPKGVYQLKIYYLDFFQEKFFTVDKNLEIGLELEYEITTPIKGYGTSHEYYSGDAKAVSISCTMGKKDITPNFFFFAALYDKNKPSEDIAEMWLSHYSVFSIDGSVNIQLDKTNAVFDNTYGKVIFSGYLDTGLYFLKYKKESVIRIFPLYIFEGFQTQFFIRYSQVPDFINCRFFFSSNFRFSESGDEYVVLEKILCVYSNFKNYEMINNEDIEVIKLHPYLVSLVNILFSSVPEQILKDNPSIPAVSPVAGSKQLDLPDILYCNSSNSEIYNLSDKLPLLSFIIVKYTRQLDNSDILFKPASLLDRIVDHINYDLFWNNFSKIDDPDAWAKVYKPLLQNIEESPRPLFRSIRSIANSIINKWNPQYEKNLKQLVGKLNLKEEQKESFSGVLNNIKDVSEMSKKFGLPPTTILRNYKKYSDYYSRLISVEKEKEKELESGDF